MLFMVNKDGMKWQYILVRNSLNHTNVKFTNMNVKL